MNGAFIIFFAVLFVPALIALFVWLIKELSELDFSHIETPEKRAGRRGERYASAIIREILLEDDVLFTNVSVVADGKQAEFDNIIVNKNGVFIVEVKNYSGKLYGQEDDFEWIQNKITPGGHFYQKKVKNPIKQVKRQVYVLSRYFKNNGINVWIDGYVFLVHMNSPVESSYILKTQQDIDRVIHWYKADGLSDSKKKKIIEHLL